MKHFEMRLLPFLWMSVIFIVSCKKSKSEEEYAGTGIGAIRAAGIPVESAKTTVIGPAGGRLVSKDGKF